MGSGLLTYCIEGSKGVVKLEARSLTETQKEITFKPAVQDNLTKMRDENIFVYLQGHFYYFT